MTTINPIRPRRRFWRTGAIVVGALGLLVGTGATMTDSPPAERVDANAGSLDVYHLPPSPGAAQAYLSGPGRILTIYGKPIAWGHDVALDVYHLPTRPGAAQEYLSEPGHLLTAYGWPIAP